MTPTSIDLNAIRAKLHDNFAAAMAEQINEFDPKEMARELRAELKEQRQQVLFALLGLEKSYGAMRLDRTNGRTSIFTDYVRSQIGEPQLEAWLGEELQIFIEHTRKRVRTQIVKSIAKDFEQQLHQQLWRLSRDLIERAAEDVAQQIHDQLLSEYGVAPAD